MTRDEQIRNVIQITKLYNEKTFGHYLYPQLVEAVRLLKAEHKDHKEMSDKYHKLFMGTLTPEELPKNALKDKRLPRKGKPMKATRAEIAAARTEEQITELCKKYNYSQGFKFNLMRARHRKKAS
jgi:hypothetical protein